MIAFLTGALAKKSATYALLDVGGVGYRLNMTTRSLAVLPAEGDAVTVHTHLHVREDELTLYGFESPAEKSAFEKLIAISGVGPKAALATLSFLSSDSLAEAVAAQDVALLSSVPGIGKKTAQRMILELAGKLDAPTGALGGASSEASAEQNEARDALLSMGFSAAEVATALRGGSGDAKSLLRYALRRLGSE